MRILSVGLREIDAGKTTISLAIMNYLAEKGEKICGFKPRAGNNLWYDWKVVREALSKGNLYGHDAKLLACSSTPEPDINQVSPAHRLWIPLSSEASIHHELPHFLLDRITTKEGTTIVVNKKVKFPIKKRYYNKLISENNVRFVSSREDLKEVTKLYNQADSYAHSLLSEKWDSIVYESYSNIGLPWLGISELDYVFAVEPFRVLIYPGERYLRAYEVLSSFPEEEETHKITKNLDPIKEIEIPPFSKNVVDNVYDHLKPDLKDLFKL